MIAFPASTKVWIAGGVTDMRRGMNTLALAVQQGLGRDPHGGEIFCFRGRKGDLVKLLWHDGVGIGVCQTSCPPISCGVSGFRGAGVALGIEPDWSDGLPVAGFA